MAAKVKKGDKVVVLAGRDKGRQGEVLKVDPAESRVVVQGVAMIKRHTKSTGMRESGIVEKEASIDVSNVALVDPSDGKPTRVGFKFLDDGRKVRFSKRTGELLDR
jgi:large subunit ribosomal protein L24